MLLVFKHKRIFLSASLCASARDRSSGFRVSRSSPCQHLYPVKFLPGEIPKGYFIGALAPFHWGSDQYPKSFLLSLPASPILD